MTTAMTYDQFLATKHDFGSPSGFEPIEIPDFLKDFQAFGTTWAIQKGRAALLESYGLGKTVQYLVWADNVVRHTNRPVLVLAPIAVGAQTIRESVKFGIDAEQSRTGKFTKDIVVTNYERLHYFNSSDYSGIVCDESSCLKDADSKTKASVTEFARSIPYRLLCTATPAPNDYEELGTSSEVLGYLGYQDMITRFFKQQTSKERLGWGRNKYRLRGYAEHDFWKWICSWARACRKPSDLGFDDDGYILPDLVYHEHIIAARTKRPGFLLDLPAITLSDQREERRRTIKERCERVAELLSHDRPAIAWGHLNDECDLLEKMIPGAVQVSGRDTEEEKEEKLLAFLDGQIQKIVSKPVIFGYGLNLQHCAHMTFFPSHSWEQFDQAVHRCLRFGQTRTVVADMVASEGEAGVMDNFRRKSKASEVMFERLVSLMNEQLHLRRDNPFTQHEEFPSWLVSIK